MDKFGVYGNQQDDTVKKFIKQFSENSETDLPAVITRYLSYQPPTVEAALIVSVDKGLISYDLKELLWNQIQSNFEAHNNHVKRYKWEKENAFIKYVAGYDDDKIYDIIEDPHGIVADVYYAILVTAKERELISSEDFIKYDKYAKAAELTDEEIKYAEIDDFFRSGEPEDEFENEEELEAEKEKFWKCPVCHQLVGMEFDACWNCQAEVPEVVEHPDTEEIIKEHRSEKTTNPVKVGLYMIFAGAVVAVCEYYYPWVSSFSRHYRFIGAAFGVFFALIGVLFVGYGIYSRSKSGKLTEKPE